MWSFNFALFICLTCQAQPEQAIEDPELPIEEVIEPVENRRIDDDLPVNAVVRMKRYLSFKKIIFYLGSRRQ